MPKSLMGRRRRPQSKAQKAKSPTPSSGSTSIKSSQETMKAESQESPNTTPEHPKKIRSSEKSLRRAEKVRRRSEELLHLSEVLSRLTEQLQQIEDPRSPSPQPQQASIEEQAPAQRLYLTQPRPLPLMHDQVYNMYNDIVFDLEKQIHEGKQRIGRSGLHFSAAQLDALEQQLVLEKARKDKYMINSLISSNVWFDHRLDDVQRKRKAANQKIASLKQQLAALTRPVAE